MPSSVFGFSPPGASIRGCSGFVILALLAVVEVNMTDTTLTPPEGTMFTTPHYPGGLGIPAGARGTGAEARPAIQASVSRDDSVQSLTAEVRAFADARDWGQFHL